jgi:hypothetical protein
MFAKSDRASIAAEMSPKCPSSSFIGGKRLQPRGEVWRLSQRLLVDESSP